MMVPEYDASPHCGLHSRQDSYSVGDSDATTSQQMYVHGGTEWLMLMWKSLWKKKLKCENDSDVEDAWGTWPTEKG